MKYINLKVSEDDVPDYQKSIIGNKGYSLLELVKIGVNVPEGFILPTDICREYFLNGRKNNKLEKLIAAGINTLEADTGKKLGEMGNPLIISIRSGAPVSMPGMMETFLNVGLNDEMLRDCQQIHLLLSYLNFVKTYAWAEKNITICEYGFDNSNCKKLIEAIGQYKQQYYLETGEQFPENITDCMINCTINVFHSWNSDNAILYRKRKSIPDDLFTAVIIQRMVFGNLNDISGTGVIFTQNPITKKKELYGEYLPCAQGEDVVLGISNPKSIEELAQEYPAIYNNLNCAANKIEAHFGRPQDIEFTYENGKVYILQTRDMPNLNLH
ncbi:MAG: hypothetical protein FWE14_11405 [Lachnospiraceae bacterium]|nr:hypothetical protein [Lachnospiraceae bacterium]